MAWFRKNPDTPQGKADSFDAQFEQSRKRAEKKKARGEGAYATDAALKRAGQSKPKRRKGDKR